MQTLNPIPRNTVQKASERRVPYEPHSSIDSTRLEWEFNETRAFLNVQLSRDPRLQPHDIVVTTDHMSSCTSCSHDDGLHASLHATPEISVGNRTQLFVDDYLVYSWQNAARFLESATSKFTIDLDEHQDARYGCPCSAFETADGQVQLTYQSGPSLFNMPDNSWEEDHNGVYSYRRSRDGMTGWTSELGQITVNGREHLGTVTIEGSIGGAPKYSLPRVGGSESSRYAYLAGYEGWRGRTCFAGSNDGVNFNNIDNERDRRDNGLNDDCLTGAGVGGSNSALSRAADTYIVPVVDEVRQKEYIWYRKDFGTAFGWREVRGMQVVELDKRFADIPHADSQTRIATRHTEWYLDRLGKLERYRRHTYCVTLTPYSQDLWLGLMTVIEWPKDLHEPAGPDQPAFERDTLNVYLVTSRDGVHIDHEWVYAHKPLLPKDGLHQADFDSGLIFPAATFLSRENEHRIYFEARPGVHHEDRYHGNSALLGTASWARDRLAGLRPAHLDVPAVITTKAFRLEGGSLRVEVDTLACGSSVRVEVRSHDDGVIAGRTQSDAVAIEGESGSIEVLWGSGIHLGQVPHAVALQSTIRLRFHLSGDAKLYGFRVVELPVTQPAAPSPPPPSPSPNPSPAPTPPPLPSPLPPSSPPPRSLLPTPTPKPLPPSGWSQRPSQPPRSPSQPLPPSLQPSQPVAADALNGGSAAGASPQAAGNTPVAAVTVIGGAAMSILGILLWRRARRDMQVATRGQKLARDEHASEHSAKRIPAARSAADDVGMDAYELNDAAKEAAAFDGGALEEGMPSPTIEGLASPSSRATHAYNMDD